MFFIITYLIFFKSPDKREIQARRAVFLKSLKKGLASPFAKRQFQSLGIGEALGLALPGGGERCLPLLGPKVRVQVLGDSISGERERERDKNLQARFAHRTTGQ